MRKIFCIIAILAIFLSGCHKVEGTVPASVDEPEFFNAPETMPELETESETLHSDASHDCSIADPVLRLCAEWVCISFRSLGVGLQSVDRQYCSQTMGPGCRI